MKRNSIHNKSENFTDKTFEKMINQNSKNPEFFNNSQREITDFEHKIVKYMLDIIKANQCVCRV